MALHRFVLSAARSSEKGYCIASKAANRVSRIPGASGLDHMRGDA